MRDFRQLTLPASEMFKEVYGEEVLVAFDGNRDAAEVHADIKAHLDGLISSETIRTRHMASLNPAKFEELKAAAGQAAAAADQAAAAAAAAAGGDVAVAPVATAEADAAAAEGGGEAAT